MNTHRHHSSGFTLIELLCVIAIVSMLSGISFASVQKSRSFSRDQLRKETLRFLQSKLELYHDQYGQYPSTGNNWYSSEPGDAASNNGGNWIPSLAPGFIGALPRDPKGGTGSVPSVCGSAWKSAYLYNSDGINYALLSHCAPENAWTSSDPFYDPVRPTWAWKVCTPGGCGW